jgi:ABC-type thiamine transport system substrate-binding protein
MKKVLALLFVILLTASLSAKGNEDNVVTVYAALDEKTSNELAAAFKEATGISVEIALQIEEAGTIAARIKAESAHPRADIFIGGNSNFHTDLASGMYLEKYLSPVVKEAKIDASFMDPNGYWTGWYFGALCLVYNNKVYEQKLKPQGVKPPTTWDDLLNPVYKGQVIASNPATTGGAYLMLAAQIFRLGSEKAASISSENWILRSPSTRRAPMGPYRWSHRAKPISDLRGVMTPSSRRCREISRSPLCFPKIPAMKSAVRRS